jgi:hypothetical protein
MGRQTGNIFRTTVSVPLDLKERMDTVAGQVNWSQVAVRAFEEKLAALAAAKKEKTMADAIQRLRASKLRDEDAEYQTGENAGREWAENMAEARELRRLEKLLDGPAASDDWTWDDDSWDECGVASYVLGVMLNLKDDDGHYRADPMHSAGFWKEILEDKYPDGSLIEGFVEGAVAFWREVEEQM